MIQANIPFTTVESDNFRELISCLSPATKRYFCTADTLRNWAIEEYESARLEMKQLLALSRSQIHISFDLWTSPNAIAMCAIVAHFIGSDYTCQSALLGMKKLKGTHSGENIAEVIIPVLEEYKISDRLGIFVADNIESNNIAIRYILSKLRPDIDDPNSRRGRCLGYIINLAAKAFIFGKDVEVFESTVDGVNDVTTVDSVLIKKVKDT